jgi:hypothetical protein
MSDILAILGGMEIKTSDAMPEFAPYALDDYEDRLAAMTLHHIDLSLLDLVTHERVVFGVGGRYLVCHPNNLAAVCRGLAP